MMPSDLLSSKDAAAHEILDAADFQLAAWLSRRAGARSDAALQAVLHAILLCLAAECRIGGANLPLQSPALAEALIALGANVILETTLVPMENAVAWADAFLAAVAQGHYTEILGEAGDAKPLIRHRGCLYFHRYFRAEKILAEGLGRRLRAGPFPCDPLEARKVFTRILAEKPLQLGSSPTPMRLTPAQQWALAAAVRERVLVLSGGPGTGKTALAATLLRALLPLRRLDPGRVRLCAPTGLAAQRLQAALRAGFTALPAEADGGNKNDRDHDLIQIPVETLHHLLAYDPPSGRFARHAGDPLDADLVLLDEASMADLFTLAALIEALPFSAALILVGDADQLPAVAAGAVLSELLPAPRSSGLDAETWKWVAACFPLSAPPDAQMSARITVPAIVLDRSHRSRPEISILADAINHGDAEAALRALGAPATAADFFSGSASVLRRLELKDAGAAADLDALLEAYVETFFFQRIVSGKTYAAWLAEWRTTAQEEEAACLASLTALLEGARILTPIRHTARGCVRINERLRRKLVPRFDPEAQSSRASGFHGAPLLITRNDASTGLFNGEVGVWLRRDAGLFAYFRRPDRWLRFPAALLPPQEPAFATTVHKSQGSEYAEVLLVLPEAGNRLLAREVLYTAVTRARHAVGICGSEAALREALQQHMRRRSGLRDLLRAAQSEQAEKTVATAGPDRRDVV